MVGQGKAFGKWRETLYRVIFEADTPAGKAFDIALIAVILLSVLVVLLDSIGKVHDDLGEALYLAEWVFTLAFSVSIPVILTSYSL